MRLFVYHNSPDQEERAQELAKELKLNFSKVLNFFKALQPSDGRGKLYRIKRYKKS